MLLPRLIVLAVAVALAQLWVSHHLGWGGDTPWIAAVLLGIAAANKFLGLALSKDKKAALEAQVRQRVEPVLTGWFPMLMCAVAGVMMILLSSVTIVPGSDIAAGSNPVTARLSAVDGTVIDDKLLSRAASPARFTWLRTSPFGRPYRLAVDGYIEESVTVYPLIGLNVAPDRDLRRSPSVLFRPSVRGVQTLKSDGKLIVMWHPAVGGPKYLVPPQTGHAGSLLVGRNQQIPVAAVATWRLELSAAGADESTVSEMILRWTRPRVLKPWIALAPGMRVVAEIQTRRNVAVERAEVVLGADALIDAPLLADAQGG
jgi:hypothetical protein